MSPAESLKTWVRSSQYFSWSFFTLLGFPLCCSFACASVLFFLSGSRKWGSNAKRLLSVSWWRMLPFITPIQLGCSCGCGGTCVLGMKYTTCLCPSVEGIFWEFSFSNSSYVGADFGATCCFSPQPRRCWTAFTDGWSMHQEAQNWRERFQLCAARSWADDACAELHRRLRVFCGKQKSDVPEQKVWGLDPRYVEADREFRFPFSFNVCSRERNLPAGSRRHSPQRPAKIGVLSP